MFTFYHLEKGLLSYGILTTKKMHFLSFRGLQFDYVKSESIQFAFGKGMMLWILQKFTIFVQKDSSFSPVITSSN